MNLSSNITLPYLERRISIFIAYVFDIISMALFFQGKPLNMTHDSYIEISTARFTGK